MTATTEAVPIERLAAPSPEVLERDYIRHGKPVILTGVANQWRATRVWNADYLKAAARDSLVRVLFESRGDFFAWYSGESTAVKQMPFGELVDIVTAEKPDRRYYMTEQPLREVSPNLLADFDLSRYVGNREPSMFLGRDTFMPCHYHGHTEALLCQLYGDKQLTMYSPDQWSRLYAHPWFTRRYQFSRVDVRQPDLERFPRFKSARPMTFTLRAGEILYIPVNWWHTTTCPVFNFNISFFWPSKLLRLNYPFPGLQHHAHHALFSLVQSSRSVARKLRGRWRRRADDGPVTNPHAITGEMR